MKVIALISGGKDGTFNAFHCISHGHDVIVLGNMYPPFSGPDEIDSHMYQSVGSRVVEEIADCMDLPLIRQEITRKMVSDGSSYKECEEDEVEDLYLLLDKAKKEYAVDGVSVGAILSDYQRVRVENVCERLGLRCLAFLWHRDQVDLLNEMHSCGMDAILIKVASMGLTKQHLGKSIKELHETFVQNQERFGFNAVGEGGEYETLALDSPMFRKKLIVDGYDIVSSGGSETIAPTAYLQNIKVSKVEKPNWKNEMENALKILAEKRID